MCRSTFIRTLKSPFGDFFVDTMLQISTFQADCQYIILESTILYQSKSGSDKSTFRTYRFGFFSSQRLQYDNP